MRQAVIANKKSHQAHQKETTIFDRRLSFLFVLFTFLFSFFSLPSNCRFQRKDKSEKRREKVAFLPLLEKHYILLEFEFIRKTAENIFFVAHRQKNHFTRSGFSVIFALRDPRKTVFCSAGSASDMPLRCVIFASQVILRANIISLKPQGFNITLFLKYLAIGEGFLKQNITPSKTEYH